MDQLLSSLRAAGEPTRLRLLAVLSRSELTVSELCGLLGQSQPRVSRHLKILGDAGLLERSQEGAWVFYRLADRGDGGTLARSLVDLVPEDDVQFRRDLERLEAIKQDHANSAAEYFKQTADEWDRIRSLYLNDPQVEQAMLEAAISNSNSNNSANQTDSPNALNDHVDIGTGTGRVLAVFADHVKRGLGVDSSRDMLAVARANLEADGIGHCHVRHGDVYQLPLGDTSVDLVTISHVLHFLDDPAGAIKEASRVLRPGGKLIVVDFARHELEYLRSEFAHRRLGFTDQEIRRWCQTSELDRVSIQHFPGSSTGDLERPPVTLWVAQRPGEKVSDKGRAAA